MEPPPTQLSLPAAINAAPAPDRPPTPPGTGKGRQQATVRDAVGELSRNNRQDSPRAVRLPLSWRLIPIEEPADTGLAAIAAAQTGLITTEQFREIGLTKSQVETRLRRGQLRRLHRGVYTTTHGPLPPLATETAALLACGETAVLSHLTALNLWGLAPRPKPPHTVHVSVVTGSRGRAQSGITLHRTIALPRGHVRREQGLPLTTPERTLADCAPLLETRQLERALDEALARHITSLTKLRDLLHDYPAGHGRRQLKQLITGRERPTVTNEQAEERLLQLIRGVGLPEPHTQVMLYEQSVDAYWPEAHFAVEVDSMQWHANKSKFERDRRKEQILRDNGITLTRATWDQITSRPLQLIVHIARQIGVDHTRAA